MKNLWFVVIAGVVLSLAVLACSPLGGQAPQIVATAKAVATEVQSAGGTPAPEATALQGTPASSGDSDLSLGDREAGLDKLQSYRMKWLAEWKSTDPSNVESASWNWTEEYSSDPKALHWIWHLVDTSSKASNMEWWQVGDTTYMQTQGDDGKNQCVSFSSSDQQSQLTKGLFNPKMLGSISDAKYVGAETVNGIKTKHYKYDEKSMALFAAGKVAGDIWIAVDGGYVVKETVQWSGVGGLFGASSSAKGDGTWNWELSDVNQPITITPPEGCGGAASGIPIMQDATDKSSFGDMVSYKSPSKLADVVEFYKAQMPAAGWELSGEPQVSDEFASMEFQKDNQTAKIALSTDQGNTQVLITIEK